MNIRQVIDTCPIGAILYRHTFGTRRFKLLAVYKPNHTAFLLDMSTNTAWAEPDYQDGYFMTEEEAIEWRKNCIRKQIEKLNRELVSLTGK